MYSKLKTFISSSSENEGEQQQESQVYGVMWIEIYIKKIKKILKW